MKTQRPKAVKFTETKRRTKIADPEHPESYVRRRRIIFRQVVLDSRPLTFSKLSDYLPYPYTSELAQKDIKALRGIGCYIDERDTKNGPDKELYHKETSHTDYDTIREETANTQKRLVAELAASLICGYRPSELDDVVPRWLGEDTASKLNNRLNQSQGNAAGTQIDGDQVAARIKCALMLLGRASDDARRANAHNLLQTDEVLSLLRHSSSADTEDETLAAQAVIRRLQQSDRAHEEAIAKVIRFMAQFWEEKQRLVAIDSGTTNIALSQCLAELNIPFHGSNLRSLTVCTNSRRIFEILGVADVPIRTIIIGGQQRHRSPTVAGAMAESFIRSNTFLRFGICFLGVAKVDIDQLTFCSDSQEEANMKILLMDRSALRVVCVDDSKLQVGPGRTGYRFASIDPRHVDLVLTNLPQPEGADFEKSARFAERVATIRACGVPVLVASAKEHRTKLVRKRGLPI